MAGLIRIDPANFVFFPELLVSGVLRADASIGIAPCQMSNILGNGPLKNALARARRHRSGVTNSAPALSSSAELRVLIS
jgi:hypothetical protein